MLDKDGAIESPGVFLRDASAFIIVCLGTESTESALFRCPWKDLGAFTKTGDEGSEGARSLLLGERSPTVVAAEKEDSFWSFSALVDLTRPSVFRDPS